VTSQHTFVYVPHFQARNMRIKVNIFTHILIRLPGANHLEVNGYKYFIYIIDARFTENKFDNMVPGVL